MIKMEAGHEYIVRLGKRIDPDGSIPFASAKELVRCKDCKYCEYPDAEKEWCKKGHIYRGATWYCADGERKDGDQDGND